MDKELNEKEIEQLLRESMANVGKRHDEGITDALKGMSHDELDEMLGRARKESAMTESGSGKRRMMTLIRLAAACAVLFVVILGIEHLNLGGVTQTGYASLFNTYYKEYKVNDEMFSAGKEKLNANGKANTAYIIQEASRLINKKHSRKSLHKGIDLLEKLLTIDYKQDLEHEIHWYLGLAYLKDNRTSKAREELQKVIYLNSPHKDDAKVLLEQMK